MRLILKEILFVSKLNQRVAATMFSAAVLSSTICGATMPVLAEGAAPSTTIREIPVFPEVQKTQESMEKVAKLMDEGEKFFAAKNLEKALIKWQEAYGLSIEMRYSEGEGQALTNMARFFLERGQFVKAKYMGENAVEVLGGISDKQLLGRAKVQLARAYFGLDNATGAGEQLDEALKIFTGSNVTNPSDAAEILSVSANLLSRLNKQKEALKFYEQAATFYVQANDTVNAISTRIQIAGILNQLGLFVAANEEAQKAVSQARVSNNTLAMISALTTLANTQYVLAEYANARKTFEQLIGMMQQVDPKKLPASNRGVIDVGYGCCLAATGDLDQARVVLERAIPAVRKSGALATQATAYNTLGIIDEMQGAHARAQQNIQQALDLQNVTAANTPRFKAVLLQNIAAVETRSGDNRNARIHLEQALAIQKKNKDVLLEGRTLSSLAEIQLKLADAAAAEALVKQAIAISEKIKDDAALWRDYTLLARIQFSQEQVAQGKSSLTSALSYFRSPQAGVFPSVEQLSFPSTREDLGQKLVAMCAKEGMSEQALLAAEQLKEEAFSNEWHRRGGLVRPNDRDVYTDLVTLRAHLHAAEASSTPDQLIGEWQNYLGRFRTLVSENKNLARMIAPVPITVMDVMKAVQSRHATIVEYLCGSESTVVFTMDPSGRISSTVLPVGSKRLQSQITALLAPTEGDPAASDQRERGILQALYSELLPASVRNFIPKNPDQMVVIIPDGCLFNLPFAALVDGQGKFLVENHLLTMASSMGVLLDNRPRYADDLSVVITSNNSSGEENQITQNLQPELVTRLTGAAADLNSISEQSRGKAVVHITNSTPLSTNPMRSVFPIASGKGEGNRKVTADRVFEQTIPSDLVLMSATSVNAKDVQGNAIKVFSRGFNYAGARNVMMSLWVEPESVRTHELIEFYKGKQEGLNQAQSLRKAQLLALSKDPSPKSWAAFQLLGPGF
ncbi:MAG: CHAT domain-containing protein [Candidatus Melainabacteria bacterium]|nr:MAG: CHAT domain-containing protein [Candidatus Melainabacteria bacterium]